MCLANHSECTLADCVQSQWDTPERKISNFASILRFRSRRLRPIRFEQIDFLYIWMPIPMVMVAFCSLADGGSHKFHRQIHHYQHPIHTLWRQARLDQEKKKRTFVFCANLIIRFLANHFTVIGKLFEKERSFSRWCFQTIVVGRWGLGRSYNYVQPSLLINKLNMVKGLFKKNA